MSSNNSITTSLGATMWGGIAKHNQRQLAIKGQPYDRELVAAIVTGNMDIIRSIEADEYNQANELSFKQYNNLDHHFGINILKNPLLLAARVVELNSTPEKEAVLVHLASSNLVSDEQRQAVNDILTNNSRARTLIESHQAPPRSLHAVRG